MKRQNYIIIALFALPVFFLAWAIFKNPKGPRLGGAANDRPPPPVYGTQKERVENWRSQEFVSLTNNPDLHQIVSAFDFRFQVPMDDGEKQELTNTVADFIASFQTGDFDDFTRFRFPVHSVSFNPTVRSYMHDKLSLSESTIQKDPQTAWRAYWDAAIGNMYSNYWVGIAVTNCQVIVERSMVSSNDLMHYLTHSSVGFTLDSVHAIKPLAARINQPVDSDKPAQYLKTKLSPETLELLAAYSGSMDDFVRCKKAVFKDIDELAKKERVWDADRFAKVRLSDRTKELIARDPKEGSDLLELNRLLLVDAFPAAIAEKSLVDNVGFAGRTPVVYLEPSRETVYKMNGSVKLATVRIFCKPRDNDPVYPVYLRMHWSPKDQKWIPHQLIAAYSRPDRKFDLLF